MKLKAGRFPAFILMAVLIMGWSITSGGSDEVKVRAQIGVFKRSGEQTERLRAKDRLKTGDLIRIYVQPESPADVYVIHVSGESVTLLNADRRRITSGMVVLPSIKNYYRIDGTSPAEKITIICSPRPLEQLDPLSGDGLKADQWAVMETELIEKSRIDLGQNLEKSFSLAGNVRGGETIDPFLENLVTYTGNGLLVKTYAFEIEK